MFYCDKTNCFKISFYWLFIIKKSFWNVSIFRWTGIYIKYNWRNWYWKVIFSRLHFDNHLYDIRKQTLDLYSVHRPEKRSSLFKRMKIFFEDMIWLAYAYFKGELHKVKCNFRSVKCCAFPTSHRSKKLLITLNLLCDLI